MQIGLEGLNFGYGSGRIIGSVGIRYGYFVANNSLLFLNGEFGTWGSNYQSYKLGIHFRQYFTENNIKPYIQLGTSVGWDYFYEDEPVMFNEITIGGGATFEVGKFGFDVGMQLNIWDNINFKPSVGVSYSF